MWGVPFGDHFGGPFFVARDGKARKLHLAGSSAFAEVEVKLADANVSVDLVQLVEKALFEEHDRVKQLAFDLPVLLFKRLERGPCLGRNVQRALVVQGIG